MPYSREEQVEMVMIYGECERNGRAAARLYAQRFPERQPPSHTTICAVIKRLLNTGSLAGAKPRGAPKKLLSKNEEDILAYVEAHPDFESVRSIGKNCSMSASSVRRILQKHNISTNGVTKFNRYKRAHLERAPREFEQRYNFSNWYLCQLDDNAEFSNKVMWTGQCVFTRDEIVMPKVFEMMNNKPGTKVPTPNRNTGFSTTVWCGILGTTLIGPFFFSDIQTGERFLSFLDGSFSKVLRELPLKDVSQMWLQLDYQPSEYDRNYKDVRQWLDFMFPERWIGHLGPTIFPNQSNDLSPVGYFVWEYLKQEVYKTKPANELEVKNRVTTACKELTAEKIGNAMNEIVTRTQACIVADGGEIFQTDDLTTDGDDFQADDGEYHSDDGSEFQADEEGFHDQPTDAGSGFKPDGNYFQPAGTYFQRVGDYFQHEQQHFHQADGTGFNKPITGPGEANNSQAGRSNFHPERGYF